MLARDVAAMAASQLHQNAALPERVNIIALQLCNPTGYINALHLCLPVRAFALPAAKGKGQSKAAF